MGLAGLLLERREPSKRQSGLRVGLLSRHREDATWILDQDASQLFRADAKQLEAGHDVPQQVGVAVAAVGLELDLVTDVVREQEMVDQNRSQPSAPRAMQRGVEMSHHHP